MFGEEEGSLEHGDHPEGDSTKEEAPETEEKSSVVEKPLLDIYEKPQRGKKKKIVMRNQRGSTVCKLCLLSGPPADPADFRNLMKFYEAAHADAYRIWSEWSPREKAAVWVERVIRACDDLGVEVSADEVKEHFRDHRVEQPAMPGPIRQDDFLEEAGELRERSRKIIETLYRQKFLTSQQIATVFFGRNRTQAAAKKAAQTDLNPLAQSSMIYKYFPSEDDLKKVQVFLESLELSKKERDRESLFHFGRTNLWLPCN